MKNRKAQLSTIVLFILLSGNAYGALESTDNTLLGQGAGGSLTTGTYNTFVGYNAGNSETDGTCNTFVGHYAGYNNTNSTGDGNTFMGSLAGYSNTTGYANTFIGGGAGNANTTGQWNAFFGNNAGVSNIDGYANTFIGGDAGHENTSGIYNVFLGASAGYYETGSHKLYIENSDSSSPLIYGEFDNDIVGINGSLGVGTISPTATLHVQANDGGFPLPFILENKGSDFVGFSFTTTGGTIDFNKAADNVFRLNVVDGDTWELQLDPNGNLTIKGQIITSGSCSGGCDRVFSPEYELPTIEEHANAMWRDSYLPAVGPTKEGAPINLSDQTERMLNELEKAHIYIDQLNGMVKEQENQLSEQQVQIAVLKSLICQDHSEEIVCK